MEDFNPLFKRKKNNIINVSELIQKNKSFSKVSMFIPRNNDNELTSLYHNLSKNESKLKSNEVTFDSNTIEKISSTRELKNSIFMSFSKFSYYFNKNPVLFINDISMKGKVKKFGLKLNNHKNKNNLLHFNPPKFFGFANQNKKDLKASSIDSREESKSFGSSFKKFNKELFSKIDPNYENILTKRPIFLDNKKINIIEREKNHKEIKILKKPKIHQKLNKRINSE